MKLKDAIRTLLFKKKINTHHQLYTSWGEQLNPEHVLEEYPRPQLKREEYTILNGYWNYCITKNIHKPAYYDGKILVPFSPESVLSGVNRQIQPDETLWYERPLIIPEKPVGKRCILHFGAVDQYCEVFINYKKVIEHTGGYLPFSMDITDYIKEEGNLLSVRVNDYSDTSYHSRGKQKLKRGGMFYTAQSGIWQTVWMEWVPDRYIEALRITPLVDQSAIHLDISLRQVIETDEKNSSDSLMDQINSNHLEQINQQNTKRTGEDSRKEIEPLIKIKIFAKGNNIVTLISKSPNVTIPMKEFEYWSPENPFLYDLEITVGEDKIESYFAMRKIEVKEDEEGIPRISLNNEPYFQVGLLDQGYWPDGLYTAPSDEAMIFDISQAKDLGFHMIRKHIKIEPLRWYYHCDRLGVLVWQDMVNGGGNYNDFLVGYLPTIFPWLAGCIKDHHYSWFARKNVEGRKEWTQECIDTILLLYNSPCVVVWVPFNEAWGQFDSLQITELIREHDFTRLVDHASGWYDQRGGDFKSIHNYFHKLKVTPEKRAVILSEFGGYACYIPEHSYSWRIYGYRIYRTKEELDEAYQNLMRKEIACLRKKGLSAIVYTQLSDVEDEVNGLFTYDRKVCKVSRIEINRY
ncbi:glycoside hydrolase family 2 [Mobilitalea sibirica]|uniref:Glycoside hydrolase family 2 n=1 Tax=Mobilitalea sibirica TaxID=1462919 RepID=A0A8J7HAY8_9FIRM|nr:sugar-binding domain-containing protein [Mobilitalea sibirica]MBH1939397.1 glycoside hydrolase family 2 [Mobilitalea sibirica]